ncbi:hypothetical protein AAVH_36788 [Aphelenchoides avenae]|nr:hypothetical protein AAVH_36788 [Aphelenchus avenae]
MASHDVPYGWVRLNVGGKVFVTMKQTLSSSPFFARLFETDGRMPDFSAESSTHFVDRDPDCFSTVLNYLRNGTLFADRNCNLEELRLEADFYGLDDLVRIIDETKKAQNEVRYTTKCVVVSHKKADKYGGKRVEIVVNPCKDDHFLLRHLQEHYSCRVRAPSFQFPYGFTFELRACNTCPNCAKYESDYDSHCRVFKQSHGCLCAPNAADMMLKDVITTLESQGYVLDRNIDATFTAAGKVPTSWTFVKREG